MKRLLTLALLLLAGFYVGWPAYSGYEIKTALEAKDAAALSSKIDFASVKESLRPAATLEAERSLNDTVEKSGAAAGILGAEIAKKVLPALVDASLDRLVTPENIIRIYSDGRAVKDSLSRIVKDQIGKSGGIAGLGALIGKPAPEGDTQTGSLTGILDAVVGKATGGDAGKAVTKAAPVRTVTEPASEPIAAASQQKPRAYGIGNIKHFALTGPLSVELGVAKEPEAKEADVAAEMTFRGTDWVLTALRPRIQ
jgi:hypothetical protein